MGSSGESTIANQLTQNAASHSRRYNFHNTKAATAPSKPPEGVDFGPNDDPGDDNVAMDEDDSLPWPDVEKITAWWWQANGQRFASGTRYFMGEPPTTALCLGVLNTGHGSCR